MQTHTAAGPALGSLRPRLYPGRVRGLAVSANSCVLGALGVVAFVTCAVGEIRRV